MTANAQGHVVKGVVQDSTGLPLPGALIKITSPKDSVAAGTDINGAFTFNNIKASEFTLSAAFLGFQTFVKKYKTGESGTLVIPPVKLKRGIKHVERSSGYSGYGYKSFGGYRGI